MPSDRVPSGSCAANEVATVAIIVFIAIALYNVIELQCLIIGGFKRYGGLYFWSFIAASWGIAFNATGYLIRHVHVGPKLLHATVILIGWTAMITGQSLVLYSRLHIVLPDPVRLRYVLAMIIIDAVWLGIPVFVLVYGVNSADPAPFETPYAIFEKLQLTVFFLQELIISGVYIVETAKLLQFPTNVGSRRNHRVMNHLMIVNVFVVLLDVSIIVLEFTEHYDLQTSWKPLVYSVKLKAEFSVLNRLVEFSQQLRVAGSLDPLNYVVSADVALERYLRNSSRRDSSIHHSMGEGEDDEEEGQDRERGREDIKSRRLWDRIRKFEIIPIYGRKGCAENLSDPRRDLNDYGHDVGSAATSCNSNSPFARHSNLRG